jgi:coenzyme Q-binding protein COQ10
MPTHAEKRIVAYTAEQMFDLVADAERYPEFLPWVRGARIRRWESEHVFIIDMAVGFKMLREHFTTRDTLKRPHRIDVEYFSGPFHHLTNRWTFEPVGDDKCLLDFYIDFAFRSIFLERMVGVLFHDAVRVMVSAFERRAATIYGRDGQAVREPLPQARRGAV